MHLSSGGLAMGCRSASVRGWCAQWCVPRLLAAALLLGGVDLADAAESVRLEVVPAVTDVYVLPDRSVPPAGRPVVYLAAAPGEYEPASFVVHALADLAPLRLMPGTLTLDGEPDAAAIPLDLRVVKRWYQASFGAGADKQLRYLTPELLLYDDALVSTDERDNWVRLTTGEYVRTSASAQHRTRLITPPERLPVRDAARLQPVSLKARQNRQFWVTVRVPPTATPGRYQGSIKLTAGDSVVARLPVVLDVLPIVLRQPALDVSIYYRGYLDEQRPEGSISAEAKSRAQMLAELKNMAAHGVRSPVIYQPLASGLLPDVLELWREAGLQGERFFYTGVTVVDNSEGIVRPRLGAEVRAALETLRRFGFDDVYFYAQDEAYEEGLTYQKPFWEAVRAAGGKIMAAGWQTSETRLGNFDVTGGDEDLFVCLGTLRPEEAARWHERGRLIYSYQNPTGGFEIPATYRRNFGLLLWQKGFDGAMPYAYQDSEGRSWHDFDSYKNRDLTFTYPTLEQPIDTLQWEGFREGVDDLRYLNTLLQLLADADGPAADAADAWLTELRQAVIGRRKLDAVRREMVGHILALQGLPRPSWLPLPGAEVQPAAVDSDDPALLGWWTFAEIDDGEAADRSARGAVAELKGSAAPLPGSAGAGVRLNGAGDIIAVDSIDIPENGTASIEGWFLFDRFAMDMQANMGLFTGIYQHASSNHLYFARTNDYFFVGDLLETGVWHHLVLTYSGNAASASFYVDGRRVRIKVQGAIGEIPAISGLSIGRSSSYLGRFLGGAKGTFDGAVDDIRVWNRVLSPDEVRAAYAAGRLR